MESHHRAGLLLRLERVLDTGTAEISHYELLRKRPELTAWFGAS